MAEEKKTAPKKSPSKKSGSQKQGQKQGRKQGQKKAPAPKPAEAAEKAVRTAPEKKTAGQGPAGKKPPAAKPSPKKTPPGEKRPEKAPEVGEKKPLDPRAVRYGRAGGFLAALLIAAAGLLALVNLALSPMVQARTQARTQAALERVMPEAEYAPLAPLPEADGVTAMWLAKSGSRVKGYCVQVSVPGPQGPVEQMVGVDRNGASTGSCPVSSGLPSPGGEALARTLALEAVAAYEKGGSGQ